MQYVTIVILENSSNVIASAPYGEVPDIPAEFAGWGVRFETAEYHPTSGVYVLESGMEIGGGEGEAS